MATRLSEVLKRSVETQHVESRTDEYLGYHDEESGGDLGARKANYTRMINAYYDLVTDFYEYGWGQSFHFAPRHRGESFPASIARHEMYLAHRIGLGPGKRALDVGCGVGGPMRCIARFSRAHVVGINNNDYQIERGTRQNEAAGLADRCSFVKGDFMNNPEPDESFDAAYAIEATCHAPDKPGCFAEVYRVLKPGSCFAGYEWCLTDAYDASNPHHREIKKGIEEGDSLPDIAYTHEVDEALREAGFEVVESRDVASEADPETPWHLPLMGKGLSLSSIRSTRPGQWFTHQAVGLLEKAGMAPKGSQAVHEFLMNASKYLVLGGETGVFTPMYFFLARKPE
jgi:sterol 24-C-methyltransferase